MAIYHLSAKILSRKSGRSAIAAAAYRAAVEIEDRRTGEVHDYTRKRGVVSAEILLPDDASAWVADRSALWNAVEAKNKRADAQVAREIVVALPDELSPHERGLLVLLFAQEIAQTYHVGVDLAIHRPGAGGDDRNHHAHLLLTTNRLGPDGLGNKVREFDGIAAARGQDRGNGNAVERLRERWAELTNAALERAGRAERVDHRSLKAQGIEDRAPTRHLGPGATAIERQSGELSRRRQGHEAEAFAQARAAELAEEASAIEAEIADLDQYRAALLLEQRQSQERAKAREKPAEQVYDELLGAIQQRHQVKAMADLAALSVERERLSQAHRDHQAAAPWGLGRMVPGRKTAWERAGAELVQSGQALFEREIAAQQAAKPETIQAAARAELRKTAPGVVERADADRKAREARELERRQREQAERAAARDRANAGKNFKLMAMSREMRSYGYNDHSERWRAMPAELRDKIEAYIKLPKDGRPAELERIDKDPRTAELMRAARAFIRSQERER